MVFTVTAALNRPTAISPVWKASLEEKVRAQQKWASSRDLSFLCLILQEPMDWSPPDSSVYRILQARILEWAAISLSRGSSQVRDWTWVSCIAGRFFSHQGSPYWPSRKMIMTPSGPGQPQLMLEFACLVRGGTHWCFRTALTFPHLPGTSPHSQPALKISEAKPKQKSGISNLGFLLHKHIDFSWRNSTPWYQMSCWGSL